MMLHNYWERRAMRRAIARMIRVHRSQILMNNKFMRENPTITASVFRGENNGHWSAIWALQNLARDLGPKYNNG